MEQLDLLDALDPTTALARFRIPHSGRLTYGAVSRKLTTLWRAKNFDIAKELAKEASPLFNEPCWLKKYAAE